MTPVVLLGLGFTTRRLARRLLLRASPVCAVVRRPARFACLAALGMRLEEYAPLSPAKLPQDAILVHTIPPLPGPERDALHDFIRALRPRRVLYISSTSVYGEQESVNSDSVVAPSEPKGLQRWAEETWLTSQPWSTLILRPAAIYGPGRGIHVRIREGKPARTQGATVVSRIHTDDLAAILDAAINSDVAGAWPCADELACSTDAISSWCSDLTGYKGKSFPHSDEGPKKSAGRSVDGRRILELLGVTLLYPGYPAGIIASLAEENAEVLNARQP